MPLENNYSSSLIVSFPQDSLPTTIHFQAKENVFLVKVSVAYPFPRILRSHHIYFQIESPAILIIIGENLQSFNILTTQYFNKMTMPI